MYVVYCCERLRDGTEEFAKLTETLDEAVEFMNKTSRGFSGANYSFRLFEVGKEIPLQYKTEKVVTEQVAEKVVITVKK